MSRNLENIKVFLYFVLENVKLGFLVLVIGQECDIQFILTQYDIYTILEK